jgi:DNA primase
MNLESTLFWCYSCHARGNAVDFLARLEGVSPILAIRWLRERYGEEGQGSAVERIRQIMQAKPGDSVTVGRLPEIAGNPTKIDWDVVADYLATGREHLVPPVLRYPMVERGFDAETCMRYGWNLDPHTERCTFNVWDEEGRLVGMKSRSWDGSEPKYLAVGDTPRFSPYGWKPYRTTHVLFNLYLAKMDSQQPVVLVEGELNAMKIRQVMRSHPGFSVPGVEPPVVGLSGSVLSARQAMLLRRYADRIVLWFDEDDAGRAGREGAMAMLKLHMPVATVPEHEGDACSMDPAEVYSLVMGAVRARLV